MEKKNASYTIIQYSPHPERYEFLNVGVIIFDHKNLKMLPKLSGDFVRVRKMFSDFSPSYLHSALEDFVARIDYEFNESHSNHRFEDFFAKRANMFRVTPVLPVFSDNLGAELENLFSELVSTSSSSKRKAHIGTKLTQALKSEGVLQLLDKKPDAVRIEKYGVNIRAHYGFQNGVYNLVDAVRFDDPEKGLAEAGKRALEGRALSETLDRRLVVVGDFGNQPNDFYDAIKTDLERAETKLFRIDQIRELANLIKDSAH